jgi:dienelactone hydrolase
LKALIAIALLSFSSAAHAKIVEETVEYKDAQGAVLEGFVAYDDARRGKVPGVLIVHEWTGLGDYVKERARMLAKLGYVAFGADIYGKGIRPVPPKEAGEVAGKYKAGDRALLRARAFAGLDELKRQPKVDATRLAAIGYCFGGTTVLELARAGADLRGVASFHGGLESNNPVESDKIKAKVVAFHGAEDPTMSAEVVKGFQDEMRKAKADWTFTEYSGAYHSFTNPHAVGKNAMPGMAEYNAAADRRSWASLQSFFQEWFK